MSIRPSSAWSFAAFRIFFGGYLAIHFGMLVPYAGELFSNQGLVPAPGLNPAHGLFPNPLSWVGSPDFATGWVLLCTLLSLVFMAGIQRPLVALCLWFGWTALFHRNNLISNPSIPYVGLLLVLCALVPRGEPMSFGKRDSRWEMSVWIPRCAWWLLALGYTFSGWTKLAAPSWRDGSALMRLLDNPLARPGFARDAMLALPDPFLAAMTRATLAAELLFAPLALWGRTRPWAWLSLVCLHIGILLVVDFADLSFGMLMVHAFTFDWKWLEKRKPDAPPLRCSPPPAGV